MKDQIQKRLEEVVKKLTKDKVEVQLTVPNDITKGDYATNIAFHLAKILGRKPLEVAEEIVKEFGNYAGIEYIEPAVPGFINFYLSNETLSSVLTSVLNDPEKVGRIRQVDKNKEAIVDYSSPNIAKPFTIGHLRSTIIGDSIANLLEVIGYKVYRDNHVGDWGTQFGKQIYAIKTWGDEEKIDKSERPVKELVSLYVKFHEEAEKNPELEEEGRKWFKKLENGDSEARRMWQKCIEWTWKEFEAIYKELGVSFTENNGRGYGEAFFEDKMGTVIQELKDKKLLKEDKGAQLVFFSHDKYPPLMIQKGDGATLYATRDLATDKFRLDNYPKVSLIVNEVGVEQSLYFKQLFETEYMLGWYKEGQRVHVGHGLYRFKEGKMSTRKGNVIWLEDVLSEATKRAEELAKGSTDVAKIVAIGALKWNDLKRSSHLDVTFDWDEILSMNGNSGPYVQYAYTRTQSVLEKAGSSNIQPQLSGDYTPQNEEKDVVRKIVHFSEIVENAAKLYSPNIVCEYLFELAQLFNNFYQKYRILNASSIAEKEYRLAITKATGIVLKQGLSLLGIQAPQKM